MTEPSKYDVEDQPPAGEWEKQFPSVAAIVYDYEKLEAELDAINYSPEPWSQADLDRRDEIVRILTAANRF